MVDIRVTAASGTSSDWATSSLVLAQGQLAWETDTQALRVGDGVNLEPNLPVVGTSSGAGVPGPAGPPGTPGQGVPAGGASGQVLTKSSSADYATVWATPAGTGGSGDAATPYGVVWLDSFTGSDDAKLAAALSATAADTYPRTIQFAARAHSFSTGNLVAFEGMRLRGPGGYGNPERSSGNGSPNKITLSMSTPWFVNPSGSQVYGCSFQGFSFVGTSTATFLGQNGGGGWYCLSMRDIFTSGLQSVLGTAGTKILLTAAVFSGDWEINNSYSSAFHIGGSDNNLWTDGMLLDAATAYNSTPGTAHLWLDYCEKTAVGPLYVTSEGPWRGVQVDGPDWGSTSSNQGGPIWFRGARFEGRNPGAPCYGAVMRVNGGIVVLQNCWASFGMSSPATMGQTPADAGVIHHNGGTLLVDGCAYDRATGVAETVPWVYSNAAGDAIVKNIQRASRGGTWTGRPRFAKPTANTDNRINDATTTLISV